MNTQKMKWVGRCTVAVTVALIGCSGNPNHSSPAATSPTKDAPVGIATQTSTYRKQVQRLATRKAQAPQTVGTNLNFAGVNPETAPFSPFGGKFSRLADAKMDPNAPTDFFGVANYANSPLPQVTGSGAYAVATIGDITTTDPKTNVTTTIHNGVTGITCLGAAPLSCGLHYTAEATITLIGGQGVSTVPATAAVTAVDWKGAISAITVTNPGHDYLTPPAVMITGGVLPGTGMKKFVDTLPGLCIYGTNNLGQCLPIAKPFTAVQLPPGVPNDGDYYELGLFDYIKQIHSNLPNTTKLRGYADMNPSNVSLGKPKYQGYFGPMIIAQKGKPVRVRFTNHLGTGASGNFGLPLDTSYDGAGKGLDGTAYTHNRATLHLRGANNPWISDGTPHQWTAPAGEATNFKKGVSVRDVPDMPATADGELTFYWPNQEGGRFTFFEDNSLGEARYSVYEGEAAAYLLYDPAEEVGTNPVPGGAKLHNLKDATVPGWINSLAPNDNDLAHMMPLIIQDKTFVPDNGTTGAQLSATDPTWDVKNWGGFAQLWFPHVYMPNQNPSDAGGINAFGRFDYGPWQWPAIDPATFAASARPYPCSSAIYAGNILPANPPLLCPGTPRIASPPTAFFDTPLVNGTAYPSVTINPSAYRFHVAVASGDREWNLGLYYAATKDGIVCKGGAKDALGNTIPLSSCTEVSMVPAVPHAYCSALQLNNCICNGAFSPPNCFPSATAPTIPQCDIVTDFGGSTINKPSTGAGGASGLAMGIITDADHDPITGLPLQNGKPCWPTTWPTDGRDGGVPDPTTAGPAFIQIGGDAGLLPAPVVIPSTPIGFDYNRRVVTVLNTLQHGLLLGPGERADVVVDFTAVPAGSALVLYNDGPTPDPAFDPRNDYYTNGPDLSATGGAPTTIAGYGPNTRTVMQFKIPAGTVTDNLQQFSYIKLASDADGLPAIFNATQPPVVVPQTYYPAGPSQAAIDTYAKLQDGALNSLANGAIASIVIGSGGSGYTAAPTVSFGTGNCVANCVAATATTTVGAPVGTVTVTATGSGYTDAPLVTFSAPAGCVGAGCQTAAGVSVLNPTTVASYKVTAGGAGYTAAPQVFVSAPGCDLVTNAANCAVATATATVVNGVVTAVNVVNAGKGYTDAPAVGFYGGGGAGATATAVLTPSSVASITVTDPGAGYPLSGLWIPNPGLKPTVTIAPSPTNIALNNAKASIDAIPMASGSVVGITLTGGGAGYVALPTITITPLNGIGSGATAYAKGTGTPFESKAMTDIYRLDDGRYQFILGTELKFTNFTTQTTIPYGYVDPVSEILSDGKGVGGYLAPTPVTSNNAPDTQYWKVVANGVTVHWMHFHGFQVQIINRIGWDGQVKPPDANEIGWRDTVRMPTLELVVLAMRAKPATLPFKLPNSIRPLDVTRPLGSAVLNQFYNIDPINEPATVQNDVTNFGAEYSWEDSVMGQGDSGSMRPLSIALTPDQPVVATPTQPCQGNPVVCATQLTVTWTTPNQKGTTSFDVQRAVVTNNVVGLWAVLPAGTALAASNTSFTDTTVVRGTTYTYRIIANNTVGYTRQYQLPTVGYTQVTNSSAASAPSLRVTVQ